MYLEATARFHSDPYLRRAGVVGQARVTGGTPDMAKEACASKVLEFLMKMIEEDWQEEGQSDVSRPSVENAQASRKKAAAARAVATSCSRAASSLVVPSGGLAIRGRSTMASNGSQSDASRKNLRHDV